MKNMFKRLLSLILALALVTALLPTVFAAQEEASALTADDYASADAMFAKIDAMAAEPARKNASQSAVTDAAAEIVKASAGYVAGSLERNGDAFTWWTEDGIRCAYSPRMQKIQEEMTAPENPEPAGIYNEPKATRGGWPSGNQVYLIGPYYGKDDSFTDQYKTEAKRIATAIGDTDGYTLYSGSAATIDKVAEAVSNGAVVIFDSHGSTDYENGYDYVTGASYSYLCLSSKSGLTSADYADGATYSGSDVFVNGAAIANHMTKNSPSGLLWMAICLGMATDTLCQPMREKGVEVVYGYSQSVTFDGDYLFEETFWENMIDGKNVATSIATMKSKWGNWDWSQKIWDYYDDIYSDMNEYPPYTTISAARADYAAFPIVVSDEDTHPGQRTGTSNYGADSLQTVKSTYTLYSQYEMTAQSNNTAYGTVSVSGNTITAKPATGYFAQGYTLLSGNATVTQDGNIFSVVTESDCTIQINFAPKTAVTVQFSGANLPAQNGYAGDSMTLPTAEALEDSYTFLGWMTAPLSEDTTEQPDFYTDSFIPTGNTTLYALYSYVDESTSSGTGDYVKVTETPADWSGEYLIVYESGELILDGSRTTYDAQSNYQQVDITNGTIPAAAGDPYKFTVAKTSGGYSFQGTSGEYFGHSGSKNTLDTSSSPMSNTISLDASGNAKISAGSYSLRFNTSADRFRYYTSGQQDIALYLKDGSAGTTYYTGSSASCEHTHTSQMAAVAATCTEAGYTAGVQCVDCGAIISGHEIVNALGHSWGEWIELTAPGCETAGEETRKCGTCGEIESRNIPATGHSWGEWIEITAPTCTVAGEEARECANCDELDVQAIPATGHSYTSQVTKPIGNQQGYTTYTCTVCGNSYQDDYTWLLSFSTPEGVAHVPAMSCGEDGITLPGADAPAGEYTFVGWVTAETEDTTEKPTVYAAGSQITTDGSGTLYALYSYAAEGEGSGDYVKVTESRDDWSGEYVIVYEAGNRIFDGSLTTLDAANNYKAVTISNSTISAAQGDAYKFTVAVANGGYSIQAASGNYIGRSADSNGLDAGSTALKNTISLNADGTVNIVGAGGAYLRYNATSGQNRFRYYKSSSYTGQQAICLYRKDGAGAVTHYTTVGVAEAPIVGASVTLNSILGVNFTIHAPEGSTVAFTVGGTAVEAAIDGNVYTVSVMAQDMMKDIVVTVYDAGGEVLAEQLFTLAQYVADINDMEDASAEIKALANATLAYCQNAAKVKGNYSGEMAELAAIPENAFESHKVAYTCNVPGALKGASIYCYLDEACELRLRLNSDEYTVKVGETVLEAQASGDTFVYGTGRLLAQEYGTEYTFTVMNGEKQVLSVNASVLAYLGAMIERNGVDEDMKNLLISMYHYYAAAAAYEAANP